ncbi:hypothetical protein EST62_00400 [Chlorobaculum sp. 24CR]|uniref:hypothetical protein n=1 Tax=Chlorobaculum sp. 24CR TaxID=2508878 RepID=UPI00100AD8A0|nr:hypothetical protein [Chlorobaculum sp. 24CR]RXK89240.1 hypothetical protein EST62_00400 [Chlorobaculum sp. 24CR]
MKPAEDSPFFYRCHLKASHKSRDAESDGAAQDCSAHSSGDGERKGGGRLDASGHSGREASGGFDGE